MVLGCTVVMHSYALLQIRLILHVQDLVRVIADLFLQQLQPSVVVPDLCHLLKHAVYPAGTNKHVSSGEFNK